MPMPLTFSGLRGDSQPRSWYRWSEILAAGGSLGAWKVRQIVRAVGRPAEKRYGHLRYGQEHMDAVRQAAEISLDA